ncbi:hypothetical protein H5410_013464 [Solanum commersonii]|uniref:Uncharacterized protein n=1 Tax=Solanum commersonii TaxID=4109 RepID=A0A9J6AUN6_SOLCO|nr:hypothetical protein H5410_013464 [Solanum commersonii]
MVSRCWCCEGYNQETMSHLFLTAPITVRLWKQFANFARINIDGLQLHQLVKEWWSVDTTYKLRQVYKAIPVLIIWELWKRRNTRKYGKYTTFCVMVQHIHTTIHHMFKGLYLWLRIYKPKLHHYVVKWELPVQSGIKCNTDRASKGNPGPSSYGFYIRNHNDDLCYAQADVLG